MGKFRLNRRAMLRGAGGIAIALPWLEIMGTERTAHAAAAPAGRFVGIFTPGGTVRPKYTPTGTETAFTMGPILAPLAPVQDKLLIIDGLDMKSAVGEQHQAGIIALLTGTPQRMPPGNGGVAPNSYGNGPSLDQVLATRLKGTRARPSLQFAIRWATGKSKGQLHPINAMNYEDNATFNPIPPRLDPQQIFTDLFSTLNPTPGGDAAARIQRKKSILDYVNKRFTALGPRLGMMDRQKIDQHLTKIRELESSLGAVVPPTTGVCKMPVKVDTADYNPRSGLMSSDNGSIRDTTTDAAIPKVTKFMIDMLVMALACDQTPVVTLQYSDTEAKHTFPWLTLSEHHHYYQHDGGFKPVECEKICTWYSQQHLYLIQQMAAVDMGGHTLLDESVIFFGSELQDPPSHGKTNMPFMLAGNGGGLRTGRWLKFAAGRSHNDLLSAILNVFGDPRTKFGDPAFCTVPLTGLV